MGGVDARGRAQRQPDPVDRKGITIGDAGQPYQPGTTGRHVVFGMYLEPGDGRAAPQDFVEMLGLQPGACFRGNGQAGDGFVRFHGPPAPAFTLSV